MKLSGLSFFIVMHFLRCSMRCCFGAIYCIFLNCWVLILLLMAHQQMIPWFCRPKVLVIYEKWSPFWMNLFWQLRRLTILWVLNAYDHKFFNKGYILEINRYCVEIWSSNTWVDHLCSLVTHQCFSWVNDSGPQSLWVRIIAVPVIVPPGSFGMQLFAGHVISVFCSAVCSLSSACILYTVPLFHTSCLLTFLHLAHSLKTTCGAGSTCFF